MIRAVLIINNVGKPRLTKFYEAVVGCIQLLRSEMDL